MFPAFAVLVVIVVNYSELYQLQRDVHSVAVNIKQLCHIASASMKYSNIRLLLAITMRQALLWLCVFFLNSSAYAEVIGISDRGWRACDSLTDNTILLLKTAKCPKLKPGVQVQFGMMVMPIYFSSE